MNTTISKDQPLIDPVSGVWDARLTSYFAAVATVVLYYDILLTLKDEVRLVWPGGLSIPKVLYYVNRYLPLVAMTFCNYQLAALRPAASTSLCQGFALVSSVPMAITAFASIALLTLRVTALYRNVRWFTPVLWTAFVLFQGLRTAMVLFAGATLFRSLRYSPISNVCVVIDTSYRGAFPLTVPGIYDFVLLFLTVIKGVRSVLSLRGDFSSAIMFTLIRDELVFFSIIASLRIFNSIVWLVLSPGLIDVGIFAEWGLESTLTSRFFLNLRHITFYQQETTAGTRGIPSATSALHAHSTSKRRGRLTTDSSVDLSKHKTTYSDETGPNEEGIPQEDIFDLDVIKSHNQRNGDEDELGIKNIVDQ